MILKTCLERCDGLKQTDVGENRLGFKDSIKTFEISLSRAVAAL